MMRTGRATYVFDFPSLNAGAQTIITIDATVISSIPGVMTNIAMVGSLNPEINPVDNQDTAVTTLPDSDGDGVYDYLDQCPNTPKGVKVDEKGCPRDSDGDGVYDDQDQCPGTPKGAKVNDKGCWVLEGIQFDTGKWDIKPKSYPVLDAVVTVLGDNPTLKLEVQGHTDNVGSQASNQKLSENRAASVMEYLVAKGIQRERLSSAGYGFSKPMASNDTAQGRAKNRRVQLKPIY